MALRVRFRIRGMIRVKVLVWMVMVGQNFHGGS